MSTVEASRSGLGEPAAVALAGIALLEQCHAFVRLVAGTDGRYAAGSQVLPGGTIGKHVRRCLDHFRAGPRVTGSRR